MPRNGILKKLANSIPQPFFSSLPTTKFSEEGNGNFTEFIRAKQIMFSIEIRNSIFGNLERKHVQLKGE